MTNSGWSSDRDRILTFRRLLGSRLVQVLLILALVQLAVWVFTLRRPSSPHLKMGNPSRATAGMGNKNKYLLIKSFYALSYNNAKGTANWVSWRLSRDDIGSFPRFPFQPDPELPRGFKKVVPKDYNGSGFDRGHLCPHHDRSATRAGSQSTFLMTNVVPQSPQNNQKAWNQLELYLRDLVAKEGKVCYVVSGPLGRGGFGRYGYRTETPDRKVVVPAKTWKVVMVLDEDVADPRELTRSTDIRLIAVVMANDRTPGFDWAEYRTTVKEVEAMTGYTFFDRVPAGVLTDLKSEHDEVPIPPVVLPPR